MSPNYEFDKKRFESFIDAIIAIILTILVLEIRVPESETNEQLSTVKQVTHLLPSFISYIASFLLIFGIWIDHHLLFLNLKKITKSYIVLNMLFILFLSIIPFTTAFAGNHHKDSFAVVLLGVNYFLLNLFFGLLYGYADMKKLISPGFIADNKTTAIFSYIGIFLLLITIPLAYVNTYISFILFILIFVGHFFKRR